MNDLLSIQFPSQEERDLFMDWFEKNFVRYMKETPDSLVSCISMFEKDEYGCIEIE